MTVGEGSAPGLAALLATHGIVLMGRAVHQAKVHGCFLALHVCEYAGLQPETKTETRIKSGLMPRNAVVGEEGCGRLGLASLSR